MRRLGNFAMIKWEQPAAAAGLISIGLRALLLLAKFAFIVMLAKSTDASTVGIYALLVTTVSIAICVIGLEIHTFTGREIVSDEGDGSGAGHIQSHFLTLGVMFVSALPVLFGFILWLDLLGKFNFALFATIVLLEAAGQELGRYLLMLSRPVASNFLQFLRGAAWMPVPTAFLLIKDRPEAIEIILWSWLGGLSVACVFGLWHIRAYLVPRRLRLNWIADAFLSARHYFAVALLTQVQFYADRFVVQYFLGEASVGVLSFYQSFANTMVGFVQTGVISVMLPALLLAAKRGERANENRIRRSMLRWALSLALAISIALAFGMPFLLSQMGKTVYMPALPVFYVLLLGNLTLVCGVVVHLTLYARRRDSELMRASLVVVPIGVAATIVAVPIFGIWGAAIVFCLVSVCDLVAKLWLLRRSNAQLAERPTAHAEPSSTRLSDIAQGPNDVAEIL